LDLERGRLDTLSSWPWLTDTSIDEASWSFVSNPEYKSVNNVIDILVDIVSKNGCLLLNIGPTAKGEIPQPVVDRLLEIGGWLKINGEAIYETRPWIKYGEGPTKQKGGHFSEKKNKVVYTGKDIRFTQNGSNLYAILLDWPEEKEIVISSLNSKQKLGEKEISAVTMLGTGENLNLSRTELGLKVQLPANKCGEHAFVIKIR